MSRREAKIEYLKTLPLLAEGYAASGTVFILGAHGTTRVVSVSPTTFKMIRGKDKSPHCVDFITAADALENAGDKADFLQIVREDGTPDPLFLEDIQPGNDEIDLEEPDTDPQPETTPEMVSDDDAGLSVNGDKPEKTVYDETIDETLTVSGRPSAKLDDETVRRIIHRYAMTEADGSYRPWIQTLYEAFDEHNALYFDGLLSVPLILITPPLSARAYADHSEQSAYAGHIQIRIRPAIIDGTFPQFVENPDPEGLHRFVLDCLLHELIHQYQTEVIGDAEPGYKNHGPQFTAKANSIGEVLNLPPVYPKRRKGDPKSIPIASEWPMNVRPEDYYRGIFRDRESEPERPRRERKPKAEPETGADNQQFSKIMQAISDELTAAERKRLEMLKQLDKIEGHTDIKALILGHCQHANAAHDIAQTWLLDNDVSLPPTFSTKSVIDTHSIIFDVNMTLSDGVMEYEEGKDIEAVYDGALYALETTDRLLNMFIDWFKANNIEPKPLDYETPKDESEGPEKPEEKTLKLVVNNGDSGDRHHADEL